MSLSGVYDHFVLNDDDTHTCIWKDCPALVKKVKSSYLRYHCRDYHRNEYEATIIDQDTKKTTEVFIRRKGKFTCHCGVGFDRLRSFESHLKKRCLTVCSVTTESVELTNATDEPVYNYQIVETLDSTSRVNSLTLDDDKDYEKYANTLRIDCYDDDTVRTSNQSVMELNTIGGNTSHAKHDVDVSNNNKTVGNVQGLASTNNNCTNVNAQEEAAYTLTTDDALTVDNNGNNCDMDDYDFAVFSDKFSEDDTGLYEMLGNDIDDITEIGNLDINSLPELTKSSRSGECTVRGVEEMYDQHEKVSCNIGRDVINNMELVDNAEVEKGLMKVDTNKDNATMLDYDVDVDANNAVKESNTSFSSKLSQANCLFNEQYGLVFCLKCNNAVKPLDFSAHYKSFHGVLVGNEDVEAELVRLSMSFPFIEG